jgi:nitroreductase
MEFVKDIEQLIVERTSTRTYSHFSVDPLHMKSFEEYLKSISNDTFKLEVVDYTIEEGKKLSTYGLIRGGKSFLIALGPKGLGDDKEKSIQLGEIFEKAILKATDLGIDTCWMAMSYDEDLIKTSSTATPDQCVLMASPLGYRKKKHIVEKITRMSIQADKRKAFSKIFYKENFDSGLIEAKNEIYQKALEMVRKGPSAGNAQPWRIVEKDYGYDFYVEPKKFYDDLKDKRIDLSYNDIGIAKCHFELIMNKYDIAGKWRKEEVSDDGPRQYAFSWIEGNELTKL